MSELRDVVQGEVESVISNEEEPVAAPSDIPGDATCSHVFGFAIRGHIADAHAVVVMQGGGDDADGGFDALLTGGDSAKVLQGGDDADHAVSTHAEQADVVEKEDARFAGAVFGFNQQGTDDDVMTTRFTDEGAVQGWQFFCRDATEHDSCGLTSGVGVDDGDASHAGRVARAVRMIWRTCSRSVPVRGRRGSRTHSCPRPVSWQSSLMYCTKCGWVSSFMSGWDQR